MKQLERSGRGIWYATRLILIIVIILALGWFVFMAGYNAANLYILASEGLNLRAACVLQNGSLVELTEYFTQDFLSNDTILYQNTYGVFTVTDYLYKLSVERVSVWPWSTRAQLRGVERVDLTGSVNKDVLGEEESAADYPLPPWEAARYDITFVKTGGRWYISELALLERSPADQALRTPDLSLLNADAQ